MNADMWARPSGYSSHGRYNAIGVPVLNLADDKTPIPFLYTVKLFKSPQKYEIDRKVKLNKRICFGF
ncbi:hypothetical protein [Paenibacillus polymyxa]|nr:hypothetical protein [Paenibacillus polymyxa]MBY7740152.1 hypothetical protein [Paenibacillus polymyxa]